MNILFICLQGTQEEWRTVFFVACVIYIVGCIVFLIFGDAELQEWAKDTKMDSIPDLQDGKNNPALEMEEYGHHI